MNERERGKEDVFTSSRLLSKNARRQRECPIRGEKKSLSFTCLPPSSFYHPDSIVL